MREIQKKQIQQILVLLKDVSNVLSIKNRNTENKEKIMDILQECQEAAIAIGTSIEKTEGQENSVVPILEEYCENLYLFSVDMSDTNLDSIQENLQKIESAINEIVVKKVACFLPYKASMWDSLESVWKAADQDPECDAYVIPIPYFDRNADGSFGEMHYEGNQYPSYVPITHYEDFDFVEIRPDKIFIHNPYDEYNLVTSVHPAFYSSQLKKYTDELVYIPYFVLDEVNPEDERAVEGIAHFCKVSGVVNADKVIVQSEQMKQVYVNVLSKWMGEHTRPDWEKKILGLGSPKLDKVINTKKEDIEIPEEWRGMMQKPDGSWKKIILYNTSVVAFLEHGSKMLEKIENVFEVFRSYQENIVLLWRPHPLMQSTIESMKPELLKTYLDLIEKYKTEHIGIYDDTPDLNRAICLADAYFGDASSVVQLCQKSGIPVMIQDVEIYYE